MPGPPGGRLSVVRAPAQAVIDLAAIRSNVAALAGHAPTAQVMAVVKADGYGHGLLPSARAALAGGATWLGVAQATEALQLRAGGITARVLTWLYSAEAALDELLEADIDVSVSGAWSLGQVLDAVRATGRTARVHVKVDTGQVRPDPDHPTVLAQGTAFAEAVALAESARAHLEVRHLANSAATLTNPAMHFDLVRPGLAVFGLSPVPQIAGPERFGLVPAMRLESELVLTKVLPAGHGVSYGHAYVTSQETVLGVVPLGYADGVPRHASGRDGRLGAPVQVGARRLGIAGRVCMDQFVLDLGPEAVEVAGDRVVLFGAGTDGEPTAEDWAQAVGTISYEIVTRVGVGVPREYTGGPEQVP